MRVADLSKPFSFTFIGLRTNGSWFADERKNIPAKIVTVSCECQLHYQFCRLGQLSRLSLLNTLDSSPSTG
jgi:hypothetical protein